MLKATDRSRYIRSRISRRQSVKNWAIPILLALIGIFLRYRFGFAPIDAIIEIIQGWTLAISGLTEWVKSQPLFDWFSAPILLFLFGRWLTSTRIFVQALNQWLPDPPAFLFSDLDLEKSITMIALERNTLPIIGRDYEIHRLNDLLNVAKFSQPFVWKVVTGPTGIGKTRLAIRWLEQARDQGWDFGIVNPLAFAAVGEWKASKPTALVLDEARLHWGDNLELTLNLLKDAASLKRPIRVLVVSQIAPYASKAAPEQLRDSEAVPAMVVPPLDDENLAELAAAMDQEERIDLIVRESRGRPRAAIILANHQSAQSYRQAMDEWVFRILPQLRTDDQYPSQSIMTTLLAACLAAPVRTPDFLEWFPDVQLSEALPFFHRPTGTTSLEEGIPEFQPDDLAANLAMHLLCRTPMSVKDSIIEFALLTNENRCEVLLNSIWSDFLFEYPDCPEDSQKYQEIRALQASYDQNCQARVAALRNDISDLLQSLASDQLPENAEDRLVERCNDSLANRPFDADSWASASQVAEQKIARAIGTDIFPSLVKGSSRFLAYVQWVEHSHKLNGAETCWHVGVARVLRFYIQIAKAVEQSDAEMAIDVVSNVTGYLEFTDLGGAAVYGAKLIDILVRANSIAALEDNYDAMREISRQALKLLARVTEPDDTDELKRVLPYYDGMLLDICRIISESGLAACIKDGAVERAFELFDVIENVIHNHNIRRFESFVNIILSAHANLILVCEILGVPERRFDIERKIDRLLDGINPIVDESTQVGVAKTCRTMIHYYGNSRNFTELNEWGRRLFEFVAKVDGSGNSGLHLELAYTCACAVNHHRESLQIGSESADLWAERLLHYHAEFPDNHQLALRVADVFGFPGPQPQIL